MPTTPKVDTKIASEIRLPPAGPRTRDTVSAATRGEAAISAGVRRNR